MLKQQAILQASLHELRMEKAATGSQAETETLEAATEEYEQLTTARKTITLLQTPAERNAVNATVQTPVHHSGHQSYQSIKANTLNSVTATHPDAKPPMTSQSPVCQLNMDNAEAKYCRNQSDMPSTKISDHDFIKLALCLSSQGEAT